jgi:Ca2+-binding EF-hand superfamily protein
VQAQAPSRPMPTLKRQQSSEKKLIKQVVAEQRRASIGARSEKQGQGRRSSDGTKTKYPRKDVVLLKAVFDQYDTDRSGEISMRELRHALNKQRREMERHDGRDKTLEERQAALGLHSFDFVESLFSALDANGDDKVEFSELLKLMYPLANERELQIMQSWVVATPEPRCEQDELTPEQQAEVHAMFALYDKDRSGTISFAEFKQAMRKCGCDDDDLESTFAAADADGNGEVDLQEWTEHMRAIYRSAPPITDAMLYGPM